MCICRKARFGVVQIGEQKPFMYSLPTWQIDFVSISGEMVWHTSKYSAYLFIASIFNRKFNHKMELWWNNFKISVARFIFSRLLYCWCCNSKSDWKHDKPLNPIDRHIGFQFDIIEIGNYPFTIEMNRTIKHAIQFILYTT